MDNDEERTALQAGKAPAPPSMWADHRDRIADWTFVAITGDIAAVVEHEHAADLLQRSRKLHTHADKTRTSAGQDWTPQRAVTAWAAAQVAAAVDAEARTTLQQLDEAIAARRAARWQWWRTILDLDTFDALDDVLGDDARRAVAGIEPFRGLLLAREREASLQRLAAAKAGVR